MIFNLFHAQVCVSKKQRKGKGVLDTMAGPALALGCALAVCAVIISFSGRNPFEALASMFVGAFGSRRMIAETLVKAIPLLIAGEGLLIAFRAGLAPVGAEGQIIIGGICATVVGLHMQDVPSWLAILLIILAAGIGGAIWAGIPGYLKAKLGVSEVINSIMMNYIALYFLSLLLSSTTYLREPPGHFPYSPVLPETTWMPVLLTGTRLHAGLLIGLLLAALSYLLLFSSPLGYRMRAVGCNPVAAQTAGISANLNVVIAIALSGFCAGIAGGSEIMGIQHKLLNGFSTEMGYDAMAVALLGKLHPVGVIFSSIFLAALRVGGNMMQRTVQIPASLVSVIQGLVVVFVLIEGLLRSFTVNITKRVTGKREVNTNGL